MNSVSFYIAILAIAANSVQGGIRMVRQSGGWGSPPPSPSPGWGSPPSPGWSGPGPVNIEMEGGSAAIGAGEALSEHGANINVAGSAEVPALLYLSTGSSGNLNQDANNYQGSNINNDGSSNAYQYNSAYNSGGAYDNLWANAQGLDVNAESTGWSALQGQGSTGQADSLIHQGREQADKQ